MTKYNILRSFTARMAIFLILFAVLLTSCSREKADLSVGIMPDFDSIPILIAKQQGFFEKEGLNLNIQIFRSALERDSALQSGSIDGTVSDALAAVFAVNGGFDIRITSATNGSYKLLAGKKTGISGVEGMKGRSVGISKNTIIEYITDMMAEEKDVNPDDIVKTIIKDIPVRLEMLQTGNIDMATLPEPLASVAVSNGAVIVGSSDALGVNPGIILFASSAVKNKSSSIAAFYKAYNKAVSYLASAELNDYADVLIKDAGFPDSVRNTLSLPAYNNAEMLSEEEYDNVVSWLIKKQLISTKPLMKNIIDDRFLK